MKGLFTLIAIIFSSLVIVAQEGTIKGTVKNTKGELVADASVRLAKKKGIVTDYKGQFTLTGIAAGTYTLTVSMVGHEEKVQAVSVEAGKETAVEVTLAEAAAALQNVEIIGRRETGYKNANSFIGTKTATALKDVPQSISYVTKELIQDQQAMRLGEVVKNFSGVNQFTFYDDITVRGFRVQGGEGGVQLINGLRTTTGFWKQSLTNYLERVEVIKGPASALFGNTSPGGTINRVTKKPLTEKRQSISFSTGSYNTLRALADFTGPMNDSKTLLYRLNLGYENAQTFRNLQFDKNVIIAPSISFIPTEKTRINFDLVYNKSNSRLDRGQAVFGNNDIYSVPVSKSLSQINDYLNEENYMITTSLNHKLSNRLQFNMAYVRTGYEEDLLEHRTANSYAKDSIGNLLPTLVEMQVFIRKRKRFVDNISSFFTYDFNIGRTAHKLLAGYDYSQERQPFGGSQSQAGGYRRKDGTAAAYDTSKRGNFIMETAGGVRRPVPNVAHFDLTATSPYIIADMSKYIFTPRAFDPTFNALHGIYVQDQFRIGPLQVLAAFRYEQFSDRLNYLKPNDTTVKQDALIPRLGLVYSITKNINLYATYAQGYNPQTASTLANPNAGGPFDPLYSNLVEAGAKSEWFNKRLAVTTSVYRIELRNVLYPVPGGPVDLRRQIGKEEAKGFEFEAMGQITGNWNVMLAYAFNEAAIKESTDPKEIGRQKPNAPKHQGSFWTKYVFTGNQLEGLGFGVGGNFVTGRNVSLSDAQTLPAYALLNAALYYRVDKFQIQFNLNNVLDKTYWVGGYDYLRLFPGAPRNWLATVAYTF